MTSMSFNASATLTREDQEIFAQAGFTVKSIGEVTSTDILNTDLKDQLSSFLKTSEEFKDKTSDIYLVTNYTSASSKDFSNYAPPKEDKFDSLVLSRYKDERQEDGSKSSQLQGVLESWIAKGFSSHAVLPLDDGIVMWIDPLKYKGQMAAEWNRHSLEVLVGTHTSQEVSNSQISRLNFLMQFCNNFDDNITHALSHSEARGSGYEGTIPNMDLVRNTLNLKK